MRDWTWTLALAAAMALGAAGGPGHAGEPGRAPLVLAQADGAAECAEGEECPPADEAAPAEDAAPAEAPAEKAAEDAAPADAPAEKAAEDAGEAPAGRADTIERAKRQRDQLGERGGRDGEDDQAEPDGQAPAAEAAPPAAAAAPAAEAPPPAEDAGAQPQRRRSEDRRPARRDGQEPRAAEQAPAEAPAPAAEDTTVEEQLEAQGDDEEAQQVRELRKRLLEQLTGTSPAGDEARAGEPRRRGDRDGADDRRRRPYERDEGRGNVVQDRGGRIIIDLGGGNIYVEPVVPDEGGRLLYGARDVDVEDLPGGRTRTVVHRRGEQIVTVRDRYGNIVRRTKVLANGREIVLIGGRDEARDDGRRRRPIVRDVPPPRVAIPRDRYVVDLGRASREDVRRALLAPPVQPIARPFLLDEVLRNEQIRAYSPRIDLDTITFAFGSATIGPDQMPSLLALGEVMEEVIAENPDEVYLVEGHTDAVGSDYDNLILSDRRAETVAVALSQNFHIPPENLVTEGYGEQYLKVPTDGPERRNRRATIRRLTELLAAN